mmetsp:Transcript_17197/g.39736  ORF Transcript_17197/g.39736 Transcript_17197/m.39736 type:complete len:772 (+) Transcript_17197:167-2482(+)|eukprot:CAMPEP_0197184024 /NCGR_PEP_ID=MMETSP1423-20130617/9024_1 /TAXON_ID=476441 /ORGANISM="Pseudo-nitzschia heimii, Strain UNC1101" /LENGTH=771 /DNA_ID=CAMNT_0042634737 /DNA_START=84 /DNA_END=2399 /DNA_ORIENTATION=-
MKSKSEKEKIELKKRLARILRVSGNKVCADCPEKRPTWISFIKPQQNFALGSKTLASFVCLDCAGLHRKLGTHICVVRSISHDQFDGKDVDCAEYSGNEVVNEIFEGHLQKSTMDGLKIKPDLGVDVSRRERFIRQKYVDLYFYRKRAHYQHIAEVNKMISDSCKPKSPDTSKSSPSKSPRKKLDLFRLDEMSLENEKDGAGCSVTVANTTVTPTNTSRTRTISDRDDSNNSDSYKKRDKKRSKRRPSTKKEKSLREKSSKDKTSKDKTSKDKSSKDKTSKAKSSKEKSSKKIKKVQKKSSSKRRSKAKDLADDIPEGAPVIGETSAPQKQSNCSKDLKLNNETKQSPIRRNSEDNNGLSGMILVFDEDSDSLNSPKQKRRTSSKSKKNLSSGKSRTADLSSTHNDESKEYTKSPLVKTTSESCDSRDPPRRSRSEITMDEITRKSDGSLSPDILGKQGSRRNIGLENSIGLFSPPLPSNEEILVSEGTSFGFGENTIDGMSGTGGNILKSHSEDISTEDGFRVIDSDDRNPWEDKGSFLLPLQNKKAIDGAIKSQSGMRHSMVEGSWSNLNVSNRSIGNKSNTSDFREVSGKSVGTLSSRSFHRQMSNRSIGNKSTRSIMSVKSNRSNSNASASFEGFLIPMHSQRSTNSHQSTMSQRSTNYSHGTPDTLQPTMKQSSMRRSQKRLTNNGKRERKHNPRTQSLLEEYRRLNSENQKKFVDFDTSFSNSQNQKKVVDFDTNFSNSESQKKFADFGTSFSSLKSFSSFTEAF